MTVWTESSALKSARPAAPRLQALRALAARVLPGVLFCVLLAGAWQYMALSWQSPLVPDLVAIGDELARIVLSGEAAAQIGVTLGRIVAGVVLAFVIAFAIAFASVRKRFARAFFEPALLLGLTIPGLVWALLCVIWFGLSWKTSVVAIGLGVAPALAINIVQGLEAVDPLLIEAAHVFRLKNGQRLRHLWLPAILPFLLAGVRLGFSLAWKVVVLVEVFGLSTGVGYELNSAFISQNVAGVLAWTVAFSVIVAAIEYGAFQAAERRLTRWKRRASV
jgi:NitT/TauT family transport system permease protein